MSTKPQVPSYSIDADELDGYVEQAAEQHGLLATPDSAFHRVYDMDGVRVTMVDHEDNQGPYWEVEGLDLSEKDSQDFDKVLKTVAKQAEARKGQVTFTVSLEVEEREAYREVFSEVAGELARLLWAARERLRAPKGQVRRVTVAYAPGHGASEPTAAR